MSTNKAPSEAVLRGRRMAQEFLGEAVQADLKASRSRTDILAQTSAEYIAEVCFASYERPDLTFRENSLMNIAMLIALGRGPKLRIHLKAAVNNGLTHKEICEACRHAIIYCGVPVGRDALLTASNLFGAPPDNKQKFISTRWPAV